MSRSQHGIGGPGLQLVLVGTQRLVPSGWGVQVEVWVPRQIKLPA